MPSTPLVGFSLMTGVLNQKAELGYTGGARRFRPVSVYPVSVPYPDSYSGILS